MTEQQFLSLVDRHEAGLRLLALSLTRNQADAEDALQEAMVVAYVARERLREAQSFLPWVRRILARECLRLYRRVITPMEPAAIHETLAGCEDQTDLTIWSMLQHLPEDLRQVVALRYVADLSQVEVARMLGIPVGTVKSRLNRALTLLRADLQEKGGGSNAL